jgi:DNA-binding response OmpR family regulator
MAKARILVVEDDADLVHLIAWRLRREGYEVSVAFDGNQGYYAALRDRPDVIVLDLLMPGFSGRELMHLLRSNPDVSRTPILLISALERSARDGGGPNADAALDKPFELAQLLREIQALIERRRDGRPDSSVRPLSSR